VTHDRRIGSKINVNDAQINLHLGGNLSKFLRKNLYFKSFRAKRRFAKIDPWSTSKTWAPPPTWTPLPDWRFCFAGLAIGRPRRPARGASTRSRPSRESVRAETAFRSGTRGRRRGSISRNRPRRLCCARRVSDGRTYFNHSTSEVSERSERT
jgi:hypothetical protein